MRVFHYSQNRPHKLLHPYQKALTEASKTFLDFVILQRERERERQRAKKLTGASERLVHRLQGGMQAPDMSFCLSKMYLGHSKLPTDPDDMLVPPVRRRATVEGSNAPNRMLQTKDEKLKAPPRIELGTPGLQDQCTATVL